MNFQPVTEQQRITTLDILRGFSLLGILLVNMFGFSQPMPYVNDLANWFTSAKDIIHHQLLDIYVQSSFYPLFSMLFGYGLAMQFLKAQLLQTRFYSFASKRFIILMLIGFFHAFFIWWGDILAQYAFCGFFLLLFIRFRSTILVVLALVLNALFQASFILAYKAGGIFDVEVQAYPLDLMAVESAIAAYSTGTWGDMFIQRFADLTVQMSPIMWISSLFTILPYMLLGAAAAKWRLIERAKEKLVIWIVLAIVGLGAGIFIKSAPIIYTRTYGLDYLKVYVGGPILSIGYIALVVLLCLIPFVVKMFRPIANAGRISMTLYIMQSLICTFIFYNWGLGLYGKLDVFACVMLAIGIYVVQLLFAQLWLLKFKQGPLEATIKRITYGKKLSEK